MTEDCYPIVIKIHLGVREYLSFNHEDPKKHLFSKAPVGRLSLTPSLISLIRKILKNKTMNVTIYFFPSFPYDAHLACRWLKKGN